MSSARSMDLGVLTPNNGAGSRRRSFGLCGALPVAHGGGSAVASPAAEATLGADAPGGPSVHELLCQQVGSC